MLKKFVNSAKKQNLVHNQQQQQSPQAKTLSNTQLHDNQNSSKKQQLIQKELEKIEKEKMSIQCDVRKIEMQLQNQSQTIPDNQYIRIINDLSAKINILTIEINKLSEISNQLLDDNQYFYKAYKSLKEKNENILQNSILNESNQYINTLPCILSDKENYCEKKQDRDLKDIKIIQYIEENKKLREQVKQLQEESNHWRQTSEAIKKQSYANEIKLKDKMIEEHQKEMKALRSELMKNSNHNITTNSSINNSVSGKINTKKQLQQQIGDDDWLKKYLALKEEKENMEKSYLKSISSVEEQNAFLITENNQLKNEICIFRQDTQKDNFENNNKQQFYGDLNDYFTNNINQNQSYIKLTYQIIYVLD